MKARFDLFSCLRRSRTRFARLPKHRAIAAAIVALAPSGAIFAADPFLDADGYYWSRTEKEGDTPVIWDRADLRFYTDGTWRWSISDTGKAYEKIGTGEFYDGAKNPGLNQLAQAIATMRAANTATESRLEQTLRQTFRPADVQAAERFESLIARLRRGEKGESVEKSLAEFVEPARAATLLAERDKARKAAFDEVEKVYQGQRLNLAMASAKPVQTMVVSERSLIVPAGSVDKPLETDSGPAGFSEAMGFPYRLIDVGDGNYYAVLQTKPQPGSAADRLELLMGDAVTAVNDRPIRSASDLERLTQPQTIVTVAKQLDGIPVRKAVDFYPPGTVVQPTQAVPPGYQLVPPGYQPLPPGYRYVR